MRRMISSYLTMKMFEDTEFNYTGLLYGGIQDISALVDGYHTLNIPSSQEMSDKLGDWLVNWLRDLPKISRSSSPR